MNLKCLSKIFSWRYAKYLLVLIGLIVLLLISLMSCKTQRKTIEAHNTHETHESASLRYADASTISDTRYAIVNETVWRPPDSLGNIYPCVTIKAESSAWRQTCNNITSTRIDSLTMTVDNDYDCTATEQSVIANRASLIANRGYRASLIAIVLVIVLVLTFLRYTR